MDGNLVHYPRQGNHEPGLARLGDKRERRYSRDAAWTRGLFRRRGPNAVVDDVPVRHDGGNVAGTFDMHPLLSVLDLRTPVVPPRSR